MRLLMDEMVPESVVRFFRERGHDVFLVREALLPSTPDPLVVLAADKNSLVVVTWNKKHFNALVKRAPEGNRARFRRAGMIVFSCSEPQG